MATNEEIERRVLAAIEDAVVSFLPSTWTTRGTHGPRTEVVPDGTVRVVSSVFDGGYLELSRFEAEEMFPA